MKTVILMSCLAANLLVAQEKATVRNSSNSTENISYAAKEVRVLGDLDYGRSSGPVTYSSKPRYSAFVFSAFGGETVEISVKGNQRKAMVALADAGLNRLAIGDTSLRISLPNRGPYIECWYIIFRDFEEKPASFTVQVNKLQQTANAAATSPAPHPVPGF